MEESKDMSWLMDKVVYELYNNGLEIKTIDYGNGYFIFDFGENSVCHFTVKKLKKWKFGVWCTESDDNKYKVSLFGEHEYYIDKFKPTQTEISYMFDYDGDKSLKTKVRRFADKIKKIAKHPLREQYKMYMVDSPLNMRYGFLRYHLSNFWFYQVRKPLSRFFDEKCTRVILKAVGWSYERRWRRKGNDFHVNVTTRERGWYPRHEFQVVYGNMSDEDIYKVYHRMKHNVRNKYGNMIERPWLFSERVYSNTRFIDTMTDDDMRGFYYTNESEDE